MQEIINELREQRAILATIQARVFELETPEEKKERTDARNRHHCEERRREARIHRRMKCANNLTQDAQKQFPPRPDAKAVQQWSDTVKEVQRTTGLTAELLSQMKGATVSAETD